MSFLAIHGEEVCSALLEEEVDEDSSGLWGGESQTPPKETSEEMRPLHHQTLLTW